jgi:hypothetical protein
MEGPEVGRREYALPLRCFVKGTDRDSDDAIMNAKRLASDPICVQPFPGSAVPDAKIYNHC